MRFDPIQKAVYGLDRPRDFTAAIDRLTVSRGMPRKWARHELCEAARRGEFRFDVTRLAVRLIPVSTEAPQ